MGRNQLESQEISVELYRELYISGAKARSKRSHSLKKEKGGGYRDTRCGPAHI